MIRFVLLTIGLGGFLALPSRGDSLHLDTAAEEIQNTLLNGYDGKEKITVTINGGSCTIPFIFHRSMNDNANPPKPTPVLLLHGITDSSDGFHPFINESVDEKTAYAKSFVALDWPHNGSADCPTVHSFKDAAEAIRLAFEVFRAQKGLAQPQAIIGHSMGTVLAAMLRPAYPQAKQIWFAPPLLERAKMIKLFEELRSARKNKDGKRWIAHVSTRGIPWTLRLLGPLAGPSAYSDMVKRMQKATALLVNFEDEYDSLVAAMKTVPSDNRIVVIGQKDHLTPPDDLNKDLLGAWETQARFVKCGHNIPRDCTKLAVRTIEGTDTKSKK